jgi:hypothetical protein
LNLKHLSALLIFGETLRSYTEKDTASAKLPLSFFMVLNASLGVLFDKLSQSIGVNAKELLPLTKGTATCMNY